MNDFLETYKKFRRNDKNKIGTLPIENRLVLSKLITNSSADVELKYVWANRAISQATFNHSSAILGLLDSDADEQKLARRMTLKLKEIQGYPNTKEIHNINEFNEFVNTIQKKDLILKQNYPNYENEEYAIIRKWTKDKIKVIHANSEEGNTIIGSNKALEKIASQNKEWIEKHIEKYILYFCKKNNILDTTYIEEIISKMQKLTEAILVPMELYKGNIKGLIGRVKELLTQNFLPVFKFSDSISGYGVHYPKKQNGEYDLEELAKVINSDVDFENYLCKALNKNGQKIDTNAIKNTICEKGILLQKYLKGKDYAIGFLKPLETYPAHFHLEIIDLDVSDVLTNGTAHFADILHYEEDYLSKILKNTIFDNQSELFYFTIEILIYLIYTNENLIKSPEEFPSFHFEDFGIQFMVDDTTGEIGVIEINGRTPSHNFNHFHLLSTYGIDFVNKIPSKKVLCTSAKIGNIQNLDNILNEEEEEMIKKIVSKSKEKFGTRLELNAFQIMNHQLAIYFLYFLEEKDSPQEVINIVNNFAFL